MAKKGGRGGRGFGGSKGGGIGSRSHGIGHRSHGIGHRHFGIGHHHGFGHRRIGGGMFGRRNHFSSNRTRFGRTRRYYGRGGGATIAFQGDLFQRQMNLLLQRQALSTMNFVNNLNNLNNNAYFPNNNLVNGTQQQQGQTQNINNMQIAQNSQNNQKYLQYQQVQQEVTQMGYNPMGVDQFRFQMDYFYNDSNQIFQQQMLLGQQPNFQNSVPNSYNMNNGNPNFVNNSHSSPKNFNYQNNMVNQNGSNEIKEFEMQNIGYTNQQNMAQDPILQINYNNNQNMSNYSFQQPQFQMQPQAQPQINFTSFEYSGNHQGFITKIQNCSSQQIDSFNAVNIMLIGNQTQKSDSCLFTLTCLLGFCLIFPFFFMCCDWWKKMTWPLYNLQQNAYKQLSNFIYKLPQVKYISITVVDNWFQRAKAQILFQMLSNKPVNNFLFVNRAIDIDNVGSQATDFQANMRPIKTLQAQSFIRWRQHFVE